MDRSRLLIYLISLVNMSVLMGLDKMVVNKVKPNEELLNAGIWPV